MSDEDPQRISSRFDALARTLITDDANLGHALRGVADIGCQLLPNCAAASVTVIEREHAITVGSTSDTAQALDDAQYTAGDGPCLTAARHGVLVRIDDTTAEQRWPDFCRQAADNGVHSSLSVPLRLSRDNTWGGPTSTARSSAGSATSTRSCARRSRHRRRSWFQRPGLLGVTGALRQPEPGDGISCGDRAGERNHHVHPSGQR